MLPSILILAASAVGINYGWEPLPEGGMKYIVQFEPETLIEAQKAGFDLESNIPSNVGDVRTIAVRLGTGPLPHKFPPLEPNLQFPSPNQERRKPNGTAKEDQNAKPQPLLQSPQGKPLATPAEASKTSKESKAASPTAPLESAKPWLPLYAVSIALIASLAGNFYLLWIYAELRKRYRALLVKQS